METARTPLTDRPITKSIALVGGLLLLMWVLEAIDSATAHSLDPLGIQPRRLGSLDNILAAPFIHYGWAHLMANSVPFFVLGVLARLAGFVRWLVATLTSVVTSGLFVWLVAPSNTITAGASGLIFGWLVYLVARGFLTRKFGEIAIGLVVGVLYGGILLGVLPTSAGVSWQAHLGGAVGGLLAAWVLHRRTVAASVR